MSKTSEQIIRVVVVDNDVLVCHALEVMLNSPTMTVIQSCLTIEEGAAAILKHAPDVAVVDLLWKADSLAGLKLLKTLHEANSRTACLLLTYREDVRGAIIQEAFKYGVRGVYRKAYMVGGQLPRVIKALAQGETSIEAELVTIMLSDIGAIPAPPAEIQNTLPKFAPREREVLALLNNGLKIKDVATALNIAQSTVKGYLQGARNKFDGKMNSYQLAVYAAIHGWLREDTSKGGD